MTLITKEYINTLDGNKRVDLFLTTFKTFESYLSRLVGKTNEYTSYSQCLNMAYSKKLNPIIDGQTYDFLRSVGELRNLLSHNNELCFPTFELLYKFISITDSIMYPLKSIDIATKTNDMIKANMDDKVIDVIDKMNDKSITHVPVIQQNKLVGVFSVSTLFDKALLGDYKYDKSLKISDFSDALNNHSSERFLFVDSNISAIYLKDMLKKTKKHEKRAAVIFVTDNGKSDGKLLGLITETDLLKLN